MPSHTSRWHRPAQSFPLFPHLAIVPALLAIATVIALFVHSDVNAALLWSQCHSHSILPGISRMPVLGTPACFLISFFYAALDSLRSKAVMSVILAYVGSLLTVSTVESARKVNARNVVISNPLLPWLVFNLFGGALVWQLVIVPAFMLGVKSWPFVQQEEQEQRQGDNEEPRDGDSMTVDKTRQVSQSEVIAIPIAIVAGYYVPSTLMLTLNNPAAIGTWLFFPAYVTLIRKFVRYAVGKLRRFQSNPSIHLEAHTKSYAVVYAIPIVCSLVAHVFVIRNLTMSDDRKEMTRSAVKFIEIDFQFIGLTMLYWVFTEVGWKGPLAIVGSSVVLGPGAGTALGWLYREKLITRDFMLQQLIDAVAAEEEAEGDEEQAGRGRPTEQTPLIQ